MKVKFLSAIVLLLLSVTANAASVAYRSLDIGGVSVFYREAGDPSKPKLLLLHGFPSSSHMYDDLMRDLARDLHLIAPDYPGSGGTTVSAPEAFSATFEGLTDVIERFVEKKGLARFAIYMQDFGGPVGFRLAVRHPDRVTALIVQNANAYEEGLAPSLVSDIQTLRAGVTAETLPLLTKILSSKSIHFMYTSGARDPQKLNPDTWRLAELDLLPEANRGIQMRLLADYYTNVERYPQWQAYLRKHQPPTLVVWGRNDPFFIEPGARAFARDVENAEIHLLDTGHFALEEERAAIAKHIGRFLRHGAVR